MSAVRANFNTASCTDATFAPSFNYATNCADTTSVVSVFVSSVVILARIIGDILRSVLISARK